MIPQLQVIENDIERDRKACVSLFHRVTGANRELAQWLVDKPQYSAAQVAEWLGCGSTRIKDLRRWAERGFENSPNEERRARSDRRREEQTDAAENRRRSADAAPEYAASEYADDDDSKFAPPEEIKKNVLDSIERQKAITLAYKKVLKSPALDKETGDEVSFAIGGLITILQSLQRTLASRR